MSGVLHLWLKLKSTLCRIITGGGDPSSPARLPRSMCLHILAPALCCASRCKHNVSHEACTTSPVCSLRHKNRARMCVFNALGTKDWALCGCFAVLWLHASCLSFPSTNRRIDIVHTPEPRFVISYTFALITGAIGILGCSCMPGQFRFQRRQVMWCKCSW